MSTEAPPPPMTLADAMATDTSLSLEMDLSVALTAIKRSREIIENNADADDPTQDAATLRRVYDQMITATHATASALAQVRCRSELRAAIESAKTEPAPPPAPGAHLRLVKS